jgi:4-amino-4-deoxy-L-arabinose transferase-like glycosyltransferase
VAFVFAIALVVLALTAGLVAATLRLGGLGFLLGAYVVAAAEVVALLLALSPFRLVGPGTLLAGETVLFTAAAFAWTRSGRPRPALPRLDLRAAARRNPVVTGLAAVVAGGLAYALVIGLVAPPNNSDSLTYRLSRAADWLQHRGLHWIADAHTQRQNEFPPNAELEQLFTLALLDGDKAATLPQLVATLAIVIAIIGSARRLGYSRAASTFAGLVFACLTLVALQSTSTQNDLITASFVCAAAFFVRSNTRAELALAGAAVGLALGTKISAWFALPILGLLALVSLPPRRVAALAAAAAVGTLVFAGPFIALNLAHTGEPFGHAHEQEIFRPDVTAAGTASTVVRVLYRFIDLSGFRVRTAWLDPIERAGEETFDTLGIDPDPPESAGFPFSFEINVVAHEDHSFFGPLGILLVVPVAFTFAIAWPLRRTSAARGVHGLALPLFLLVVAFAFRFSDEARYLVVPVALVSPLVAATYRWRVLAAAIAGVAALTLVFAHGYNELKPTGLGTQARVWSLPRVQATALDEPQRAPLLAAVEEVPPDARVGVVLGPSDWDYPLYGTRLDRELVRLPDEGALREAERLGLDTVVFGSAWRPVGRGWRLRRFEEAGTLATRD